MFCAISIVCEMIKRQNVVDVFHAVKSHILLCEISYFTSAAPVKFSLFILGHLVSVTISLWK
uniref:Uncharacterized protein n=1 Tax=Anguilla anguilla TaxID=7936 RepID=A0A0E9T8V4_ANGAN